MVESFSCKEVVTYPNGGKSFYYISEDTVVIIDDGICNQSDQECFSYRLITEKQNEYMRQYDHVYRFLIEDREWIDRTINIQMANMTPVIHHINRQDSAEASPLEFMFEKKFADVYGEEALSCLEKEYGIADQKGHNYFLDYYVQMKDGKGIAVEENGITYHHPQLIGVEKYRKQLCKQNTCTHWGIKLYRFSTEDCEFAERIEDDIRSFFGNDASQFQKSGITVERQVQLYDHQVATLQNIQMNRQQGIHTFLVVFPTASGKSRIVEEDLNSYAKEHPYFRALILAPNVNIIEDWKTRIQCSLQKYKSQIEVQTYAYMVRHYLQYSKDAYDYIVIDEAHHAVAPMLKRVIQYFTPDFMIGLTATDQRPDKKRLESIFGSYKTNLSLVDAMKKGIVAEANVYRLETNIDLSHVRFNGVDYVNADLEKTIRVNSRNELIVQVILDYFCEGQVSDRQGIIFCVNTKHTQEMEKLLLDAGISAKAYTGKSKYPEKIMKDFKEKNIRFLCACNMISEGWDYPELGILIMARPTLSKVLYLQQIGRGLRKTDQKKNVFIIDVVDEYGAMTKPWSMHSLFHNTNYIPMASIIREFHIGDMIEIDGLSERVEKIIPVDISNFEEQYGDYLSQEQLAREYYVNTGTITNWIRKGRIQPTITYPFGNRHIPLFSPEDVNYYREALNIPIHNDETIKQDFFDFLEERDYSLSYKMPFLLALIKNMDVIGDAKIEDVLTDYIAFYQDRICRGLPVDKSTCPYSAERLKDRKFIKSNMMTNPFEKFERKRFLYQSKDLGVISMNHALFSKMTKQDFEKVEQQMKEDLNHYYKEMGN